MITLQPLTLETRLPRSLTDDADRALKAYAALFSRSTRHYYSAAKKGEAPKKPVFSREHGLTARQFNAVKVSVEGMVQSQIGNLPGYLTQAQQKAERLEKRLIANREKAQVLDAKGQKDRAQKLWRSLPGMRSKIQHLHSEAKQLAERIKSKTTAICFGSKRLFNAQHHLAKNDYADHQAWKNDWQASRSNQFFVLGSSDENGGCQGCVLLPGENGTWLLQVRLPEALIAEHGKYAYLDGISFSYQGHVIEQAHARQQLRSERKKAFLAQKKSGELDASVKESEFLEGLGQALSYRFVRDRKGWRVLISTSVPFEATDADFSKGALGIDFNAGFVSVANLNPSGHKQSLVDRPYARLQATSRQNKTAMQALAIQIVDQANAEQKPIVIESLDFARKKSSLQKGEQGQARYNAMLSSLSYRLFRQSLTMQCLKQGVALVQVNPAYTSLLGKLKYNRDTDFNTHQAAAWVIGRRGMGLKERVPRSSPCRVRQQTLTFVAPADARTGEQCLKKLSVHYATWVKHAWMQASRVRECVLATSGACRTIPF
jgi:IS605 OrfB family transposase